MEISLLSNDMRTSFGDVTYLQTRDDTSIKAPLCRQNHLSATSQKRSFQFSAGLCKKYSFWSNSCISFEYCSCPFCNLILNYFVFCKNLDSVERIRSTAQVTWNVKIKMQKLKAKLYCEEGELGGSECIWGSGKPLQEVGAIRGLSPPINLNHPACATILHSLLPPLATCVVADFEKYFWRN